MAERAQDLFRGQRGEAPMSSPATHVRRRISVRGVVQGVGFRPFAWRRATRLGLAGFVENDTAGVTIESRPTPRAKARIVQTSRRSRRSNAISRAHGLTTAPL